MLFVNINTSIIYFHRKYESNSTNIKANECKNT